MITDLSHECPKCLKTFATDKATLEKYVGFRLFRGIKYVQSWCRKCRKEERQEKRLLK